jgi:hypothetical protein
MPVSKALTALAGCVTDSEGSVGIKCDHDI